VGEHLPDFRERHQGSGLAKAHEAIGQSARSFCVNWFLMLARPMPV